MHLYFIKIKDFKLNQINETTSWNGGSDEDSFYTINALLFRRNGASQDNIYNAA